MPNFFHRRKKKVTRKMLFVVLLHFRTEDSFPGTGTRLTKAVEKRAVPRWTQCQGHPNRLFPDPYIRVTGTGLSGQGSWILWRTRETALLCLEIRESMTLGLTGECSEILTQKRHRRTASRVLSSWLQCEGKGTSSPKAHGDRAGCASAVVETRGVERSAATL